jgi:hypothetical protein
LESLEVNERDCHAPYRRNPLGPSALQTLQTESVQRQRSAKMEIRTLRASEAKRAVSTRQAGFRSLQMPAAAKDHRVSHSIQIINVAPAEVPVS